MINMRLTVTECISEREPCWSIVNNNNNKNNNYINDNGSNYKTLKSSKTDSATANFLSASRKSWNKVELLCEKQKPSLWNPKAKSLESDEFFCFISICKFGSFKNPFATIASLSELYFIFKRKNEKSNFYELWQQHKQLKTMEMRLDLIYEGWGWRWGIHTSIPTWTDSQNSQAAAEALSLKISSHETSLIWSQRPSQ